MDVPAQPLPPTDRAVGIDLGVGALVATSDGGLVEHARFARRSQAGLARAQRELATKQRGSHRRQKARERVAAHHRKIANQRRDFAHQLSRQLVNDYDLIVHENLQITNMTRRPRPRPNKEGGYEPNGARAKSALSRSIHDAGWGQLLAMTAYKAESAGRQVIAVDPRYSSQRCSECGHTSAENRRGAVFRCLGCGFEAHADVNAAVNILRAGRARQLQAA